MFSGIIETIGYITHIAFSDGCQHITITPQLKFDDLTIGDSIAINGVCLTVTSFTDQDFNVTIVPETLRLTNLNQLDVNLSVNLERSLKIGGRLGGHYVQGHVDCMGKILECSSDGGTALLIKIEINEKWSRYIVNKGYITLDGMSITVIESTPTWFTITLIPHTQEVTIANRYTVNSMINIEVDILGKYVEKLVGAYTNASTH